jgi:phage host-nuclease inhibitor protein Gam
MTGGGYSMAKMDGVNQFGSWSDVDQGLRRMGEIDIALTKIEGDMTLRVHRLKADYEAKAAGMKDERKNIECSIERFAEERKEEFARIRSKELTFGVVAYRVAHKIVVKSKKATVAAMEVLGLTSYLRITREPDKEAMKTLDAATLAKVGASLKTDDRLHMEPNIERIKDKEAV